jgi:hypothetical protein
VAWLERALAERPPEGRRKRRRHNAETEAAFAGGVFPRRPSPQAVALVVAELAAERGHAWAARLTTPGTPYSAALAAWGVGRRARYLAEDVKRPRATYPLTFPQGAGFKLSPWSGTAC